MQLRAKPCCNEGFFLTREGRGQTKSSVHRWVIDRSRHRRQVIVPRRGQERNVLQIAFRDLSSFQSLWCPYLLLAFREETRNVDGARLITIDLPYERRKRTFDDRENRRMLLVVRLYGEETTKLCYGDELSYVIVIAPSLFYYSSWR